LFGKSEISRANNAILSIGCLAHPFIQELEESAIVENTQNRSRNTFDEHLVRKLQTVRIFTGCTFIPDRIVEVFVQEILRDQMQQKVVSLKWIKATKPFVSEINSSL
jgi:hypothetical protein